MRPCILFYYVINNKSSADSLKKFNYPTGYIVPLAARTKVSSRQKKN